MIRARFMFPEIFAAGIPFMISSFGSVTQDNSELGGDGPFVITAQLQVIEHLL
jgi:hypothetical protein